MGKQLARKGRTDDEAQKDATTDSCLGFGARQSKFAVLCVEEYKRGFSFFC